MTIKDLNFDICSGMIWPSYGGKLGMKKLAGGDYIKVALISD